MPVPCPDGYTSLPGIGVCTACPSQSCDKNGVSANTPPAGYYIRNNGHSIYQCPPGYSCSGGTSVPVLCSSGTYAPIGSSSCITCPLSYYCPTPSIPIPYPCDPFSYSLSGSTKCTYCPVGSSCTSTGPTACAANYLSLEG